VLRGLILGFLEMIGAAPIGVFDDKAVGSERRIFADAKGAAMVRHDLCGQPQVPRRWQRFAVQTGKDIHKGFTHQTDRSRNLAHAADPEWPTLPPKIVEHAGEDIERGRQRLSPRRWRNHGQPEMEHVFRAPPKLDRQQPHDVKGQSLTGGAIFDERDDGFRPKRAAALENPIVQFFAVQTGLSNLSTGPRPVFKIAVAHPQTGSFSDQNAQVPRQPKRAEHVLLEN